MTKAHIEIVEIAVGLVGCFVLGMTIYVFQNMRRDAREWKKKKDENNFQDKV